MESTELKVRIINAPDYFKHLIGQVGVLGDLGKSGETRMVMLVPGKGIYLKPQDVEAA